MATRQSLVLDIGNTRTKGALFCGEEIMAKYTWDKLLVKNLKVLATNHSIERSIFCVTGKLPERARQFAEVHWNAILLDENTPLPISNRYQTPATLGKDRLAAVVGAHSLFPGQNCLIVDAGTCITYDWLLASGEYLGGNIAPGLRMRLRAMHHFTARLPLVEPDDVENPIGYSTSTALRNGAVWGAMLEVEGYIRWGEAKFGDLQVVFTGGDAKYFASNLKREIFAHPDLVLLGLNKILNFNES